MTTQNMIGRAYSSTPATTTIASWDSNLNLSANNHLQGFSTTATVAGTTVLTVASTWQQFFTGSTTQTVTLPVTSTLVLGHSFYIVNLSSGNVTVNSSGANAVQVMAANTTLRVTCILTSGTTAASWTVEYVGAVSGGTVNTGTAGQLAYYATSTNAVTGGQLGNVKGTTTNDNAAAGNVGELIDSTILGGSAVSLSSQVTANVTSISLTAGDWMVWAIATFNPNAATTSQSYNVAINTSSAAFPALPGSGAYAVLNGIAVTAGGIISMPSGMTRISIASTTTVYLVVNVQFAINTMSVYGYLGARRVR